MLYTLACRAGRALQLDEQTKHCECETVKRVWYVELCTQGKCITYFVQTFLARDGEH